MLLYWSVFLSVLINVDAKSYQIPLQGNIGGHRTLVLLDDLLQVQVFSNFFENLTSRGYQLKYLPVDSADVILVKFGKHIYDNIILFAPSVTSFHSITFGDILDFVNAGGNLMVAVNDGISDNLRNFAASCGVEFDKKGSQVVDHFHYESSLDTKLQHSIILSHQASTSPVILGEYISNKQSTTTEGGRSNNSPVLYRGIGHVVDDDNILAIKVLQGNPTTYSALVGQTITSHPENSGTDTLLVSALQARNNARVLFSGSIDLFSNIFFNTILENGQKSGNELFTNELSKWVFGERGILRFRNVTHCKMDGSPPDVILHEKERPDLPITLYPDPEITRNSLVYRIKDDIRFSIVVEQYDRNTDHWAPFTPNDMQLEFVMMNSYVRKTFSLDRSESSGVLTTTFTAPDDYGVYKFRVLYRRLGYSVLHTETQVSIRPFKHNEYDRFIHGAYPYYFSAFSIMFAFFVFSITFLFTKDIKN